MKRMLVVVDGSVQGSLALDRALEIGSALHDSELLLLNVPPETPSWQTHDRTSSRARLDIAERITDRALAKARLVGVPARARIETGETAEVAAKIAREERCDHIFVPEADSTTPVARALYSLTGLSTVTASSRILALTRVPVTIFKA